VELAGWDVTITLGDGKTETRHAFSDPDKKDTDGDGLNDGEEYAARTDPNRKDTDGDLLSDYAEVVVYKSNPLNVDSDGDSRGPNGDKPSDPNLWDGYELAYAGTSPTLADTDGDGLTDYEEIHSGGTNPLVADLPGLTLDLYGDPHIELSIVSQQVCTYSTIDLAREEKERGEARVGKVVSYAPTSNESTVFIERGLIQLGDRLRIRGPNTDFQMDLKNLKVRGAYATLCLSGEQAAIPVGRSCVAGDDVYVVCKRGVPPFFLIPLGLALVGGSMNLLTVEEEEVVTPTKPIKFGN